MKKLKSWQVVLLVLFYPIGICYLIYRANQKRKIKRQIYMNYVESMKKPTVKQVTAPKQTRQITDDDDWEEIDDDEDEVEEPDYLLQFNVAGVTYSNDDGTSRQENIKSLFHTTRENRKIEIVETSYQDKPAYKICVNNKQIGNVPKEYINSVKNLLPSTKLITIRFGGNKIRRGEKIPYYATVTLWKDEP